MLFVVQRSFYAYDDTRTPFFFTIVQCALVVLTAWGALWAFDAGVLPAAQLTAAVALGQSFSSVVQVIIATWLLNGASGASASARGCCRSGASCSLRYPPAAAGWLACSS